ncbi:HAD domain-containing protein [Acrocarpospora sp. B8E8]|uniref:HAD domain-containing protein n=1 Tax=Acrocarpospora sp. B8E8 TaxID=3153572 RepID=UPI00325CE72A
MTPMVLLDVDGVLNPSRRSSLAWRRYTGIVDGEPYKILLDPRHGPQLLTMARECGAELVWATTWEEQANDEISPRIGLPRLPVIPIGDYLSSSGGEHFKTGAVAAYVQRRPFVWFDDMLDSADQEYLSNHPGVGDFLLIHVDARFGLTDTHLAQAREWLSRLPSADHG